MNAICLVVDRLHVGHLGAYGNSWIETPAVDRLAGQAFVCDQALIDSPRLERLYQSYWQGWHAAGSPEPSEGARSLAALLRDKGIHSALLTDEQLVARHPGAVDFDELIEIDPPWEPRSAEEIEQTHLAQCFVQILDWLQSAREPFLLWCHLAGLGTTWDAPLEFRRAYWEEGDPPPPESAHVPEGMLAEDHDPDRLLGVAQSYAGQVSLLDTCLGALTEFCDDDPLGRQTVLALTSSRGFPLGEHRRVGPCDEALYGELVQVPLMLRFPDGLGEAGRSGALVEPADLWATLLECCGVGDLPPSPTAASLMPIVRRQGPRPRDRLCVVGEGTERAIRTPAWHLRAAARPELFVKPDDRWEVNNVADRCRDVLEGLLDELTRYEQAIRSCRVAELPPLSGALLSGLE
ncbi:MAG TPA: sulfatase-like hydrolase/transferase [Thermoguttaceae bacterium]|nr:sulfatase-like hydrolase/transferase [Thermoguttaceae bacterium]